MWLRSWQRNSCLSERTSGCAGVVLRRWENENDRIDLCNVTTTVTRYQTPAPPPSLPSGGDFTTFTWLIQTQPQLAEASFEQVQEISKSWNWQTASRRSGMLHEMLGSLFCEVWSDEVVNTAPEDWKWSCWIYSKIPVFFATLTCHHDTDRS